MAMRMRASMAPLAKSFLSKIQKYNTRSLSHNKINLRPIGTTTTRLHPQTTHPSPSTTQQQQRRAQSSLPQKGGFRLRALTEAVSIAHGNYDDDDAADDAYSDRRPLRGKHLDGREFSIGADAPFDREKMSKQIADEKKFLEEEKAQRERKERWIENAKPKARFQDLDPRGRAYGRGGRKTARAQVWVFPGTGCVTVNKMDLVDYFRRARDREQVINPMVATRTCGMFDVVILVSGGGKSGQAGAIRHGLSRALEKWCPDLRPPLKFLGYLTRDPRKVERKKIGLKKARKAPQWVKR